MDPRTMDARLVAQAINYHGQQLQKVWESERNESELAMLNLKEPNTEIYQQRQKTLSFSDRGKRLKLQQFIAKKADTLYDKSNLEKSFEPIKQELGDEEFYATMPGLDSFVIMEKSQRIRNFLECLLVGDVIYAQVMGKSTAGLLLKILCNCSDCPRIVTDLSVKALILNTATVPAVDKKGITRGYMATDLVCVVVSEVNVEDERVVAVMNVAPREGQAPHPPMGLIHADDLPEAYKKAMDNKGQSYETILGNSTGFNNPNNIKYLCDLMGLGQEHQSNMVGLREAFAPNEYAIELRQTQASKWAFKSVAEGIDHFKSNRHTEAFQCLNKALTVDPRNVEGLVARGALYANSGSFTKAIEDFETALKINPTHANARKYMAETLFALGRLHEDDKKFEDAFKAYESCLAIDPRHTEARNYLEHIKSKTSMAATFNPIEAIQFKSFENEPENSENLSKKEKKKRKKERKSRLKKRQRWSSSSSSSSSGSSSSSSSDSSSSSSSGTSRSASRSPSRKRKHKKDHGGSLSPLSKRMAQYNNPPAATATTPQEPPPPYISNNPKQKQDDYEAKLRKFLEQTKDESDYEEKVRRFLDETTRYRNKEKKQAADGEKSKKKKKKDKKGKDKEKEDKKSRKKKKKEERKKRKSRDKLERLEALKNSSIPDLEQLESKLNAYYAKVEKETAVIKSNEKLAESRRNEELRKEREREREREEASKAYHERDTRLQMSSQQRKDYNYYTEIQRKPISDIFDHESHMIHSEPKMQGIDSNTMSFDHHSQMMHSESKMSSLDSAPLNSKWKAVQSARQKDIHTQKWQELQAEKKMKLDSDEDDDNELEEKVQRTALEKSLNIRKQMQREIAEKRVNTQSSGSQVIPAHPPEPPTGISRGMKSSNLGKGHRTDSESDSDKHKSPKKRDPNARAPGQKRNSGDRMGKRSRSRSRSGSSSRSSRSRSPRRSRSRSYSNRRSNSYERKYSRSPSRSYTRSRSRSRSRSYSRSRSRSRSGDRGYHRRRQFRPYNNNRGTYYKPRFQNFHNNRGGGGGGNFQNRNRYFNNQHHNNRYNHRRGGFQNRGGGNFQNRGGRMNNNNRGRYFRNNQNYRDNFRDRRDFRDRRGSSRDRYSDRSYSPDPMRKVDEAKEKINKMLENESGTSTNHQERDSREGSSTAPPPPPNKRQDGPLSEGEERDDDDYTKWAENEVAEINKSETGENLDGKDSFIERMKQRSKTVLLQREILAKIW